MGQYNDFDLDIKTVQEKQENDTATAVKQAGDTNYNSCGWLTTSCSAHCR